MTHDKDPEPFCAVAERDGKWVAVSTFNADIGEFYREHAGLNIRVLATRQDWTDYLDQQEN